jgi:hypothetical protein
MRPESNAPHEEQSVKLPDEVWSLALSSGRVRDSFWASVRLLDGTVLDDMIISSRGYVLGKLMDGLAGAHGGIDFSMLTFRTSEIEGIRIGRRRSWQRPVWVLLNPDHPARRDYRGSHTAPLPRKPRVRPPLGTMITVGAFFTAIIAGTILAVIGLAHLCGWLK